MPEINFLKLSEQLCFPLYATSRMITRLYQPLLESLDITYPQYLVMLVLWEENELSVGKLGERLYLNTNTLTPMLKKMQGKGLLTKQRSTDDERTVFISLTTKGRQMKNDASCIPVDVVNNISMPVDELTSIREQMWNLLKSFDKNKIKDL